MPFAPVPGDQIERGNRLAGVFRSLNRRCVVFLNQQLASKEEKLQAEVSIALAKPYEESA